jgi:oligo-1,6-glucosidase/alpha-glucosidase
MELRMQEDWWKSTSIYQIYPRSFADSNNDGIGDIPGIISKLDYIKDLGFETVWLSPHYKSPQKDFGYDITDYRNIASEYGTFDDALLLIDEVHKRDMKIVFDMILNHTSDEHPWFIESRSSCDNPKRDWYIWKDGKGKRPPNNWMAIPGGSGWKLDKQTGQWYFHNFLSCQPDLNFRNPEVKEEMFNTLRFWLEKGVDGFRLDIFHSVYKDEQFRDNPFSWHLIPTPDQKEGFLQKLKYNLNRPETFELAKEVRTLLNEYEPARFAVGEVFGDGIIKNYLGDNEDGLNLILLFDLIHLNKVNAQTIKEIILTNEAEYPSPMIPTYCLGNHDRRRYFGRIGENIDLAKLLAFFIYTVRCVPINYYGDELGIPDGDFAFKNALDGMAKAYWWLPKSIPKKLGLYINRDGCRTPMQWDTSVNAGFSKQPPWLPVHSNYLECNVEVQREQENSIFNCHRQLLHLRQQKACLRKGSLELLLNNELPEHVVAYDRILTSESHSENILDQVRVFMNFSSKKHTIELPDKQRSMLVSSSSENKIEGNQLILGAWGGVVI